MTHPPLPKTVLQPGRTSMGPSVLDRFVPEPLQGDDESLRLSRLVAGACLMVGTSSVGLAAARFVVDAPPSRVGWAIVGIVAVAYGTLAAFQRIHNPALMGTVLALGGLLGTCTMALMEGGLFSEGLYWTLFVPLVTALFTGARGAAALAVVGTVFVTVLFAMHLGGHDFGKGAASPMSLALHWMGLVGALNFGAYIGVLFEGNRVRALDAKLATEADAARMKDELLGMVSHELRTPLTAIRGSLGLLGGGISPLDADASELVDIALQNAQRLNVLIDDLLDLQKIDAGAMTLSLELVPLQAALRAAADLNLAYAQGKDVGLRLQEPIPDAGIAVDPSRLQQVLANLLSNAVKYSPPRGEVVLRALRREDRVRLEVQDWGPGIPDHLREMVFDRFCQAEDAKPGSGLGLSIAKAMTVKMGGEIGLESEVGRGTTFFLEFPVRSPAPPVDRI